MVLVFELRIAMAKFSAQYTCTIIITHLQKLSISPISNKKNVAWRKSLQIDVANVDDMSYRILT